MPVGQLVTNDLSVRRFSPTSPVQYLARPRASLDPGVRWMNGWPDAGRGQPGLSVTASPAAGLEEAGDAGSMTGSAGLRKTGLHELAGSLDDGVGWPVDHVIQPGEDAGRVGMALRPSRAPRRRDRERRVSIGRPRRALHLARASDSCTRPSKCGGTEHNSEQWHPAHRLPPLFRPQGHRTVRRGRSVGPPDPKSSWGASTVTSPTLHLRRQKRFPHRTQEVAGSSPASSTHSSPAAGRHPALPLA
jgi:hypothetical protein